jgi:hypothetical protein
MAAVAIEGLGSLISGAARIFPRSSSCAIAVEDVFGPIVSPECLEGFDFTLLFEESILAIPILGLLVLLSVPRMGYLLRSPHKAHGGLLHLTKLVNRIYTGASLICSEENQD